MADDPINPLAQEREGDLACEIKLRGGEPPMKDVTEISRRWAKATLPYLKRVFTDPEAMASLEEELEDFLSRREQDH